MKKALITGVTGQTGSYLAEHLLNLCYEVHGVVRRSATFNTERIDHLMSNPCVFNNNFFTHYGDVTDANNMNELISKIQPDEIYNLAAQSHVKVSFEIPSYTANVDAIGTLNVLEAVRNHCPKARVYQASTSEMFGGVGYNMPKTGYTEKSPFHPRSPYGCAKLYAFSITRNYREAYNMYFCNGLLFNHESPRRGETFVTKKITSWCGRNQGYLKTGNFHTGFKPLELGNLHAHRDWGHAKDYARAQHLILQQDTPQDYVIATGETHTIKEFVEKCFRYMNLYLSWVGENENEVALLNGKKVIVVNPRFYRPSEVDYLLGDPTKAKTELKWKPEYSFDGLINDMMEYDLGRYDL